VLQADGGTRTASVTGASVALYDALSIFKQAGVITQWPLPYLVAGVSVGIFKDQVVLDMDYREDSEAEIDMNVIMTEKGEFVEVQGTGESHSFSREQLDQMLDLAGSGIRTLIGMQKKALGIEK
ncbi:MAG TPA: ribonuclease PH, partial [bacterium]|nr:ribonuclease PH [bacterium]